MNRSTLHRVATVLAAMLLCSTSVAALLAVEAAPAGATGADAVELWGTSYGFNGSPGLSVSSISPLLAPDLPAGVTVTQVATDGETAYAVTSAGQIYSWGDNQSGQLGDGSTVAWNTSPVLVQLPAGEVATSVAAGGQSTALALTQDGKVWEWGNIPFGVLVGYGSSSNVPVQVQLPGNVGATMIAMGPGDGFALGTDGNVYGWGSNGQGQLLIGNTSGFYGPIAAHIPAGVTITGIASNGVTVAAVTSTGSVLTWGYGDQGVLGVPSPSGLGPFTPAIPAGEVVTKVSVGGAFMLALTASGDVWSWGQGSFCQLGNSSCVNESSPVEAVFPAGVTATAIAASAANGHHSLAMMSDGSVYSWGYNYSGQLGRSGDTSTPAPVTLAAGVTPLAIAAGTDVSMAYVQRIGQTVSFTTNPPANAQYNSGPYAPIAIASSSLPVTLAIDPSSTSGCTLTSSDVNWSNAGTCVIDASQAGNGSYESASAQQSFDIGDTSTTLGSSPNASDFGQQVTYTATVSPVADGGTVAFTDDGTAIAGCGAQPLDVHGAAHCTTVPSSAGDHTIVADYSGDTRYSASNDTLTQTVNPEYCDAPCISVGDASVLEGDAGTQTLTFPVTLSQPATSTVTVGYNVTGITATGGTQQLSGVDFKLKSGVLSFKPNIKTHLTPISKTITVTVYGDTSVEPNETLQVSLLAPTGPDVLGRSQGIGTIINDDGVTTGTTLGIADATIVKANSGTQAVKVPITLSLPAASKVTVQYTITPGTATYSKLVTGGGDYGGNVTAGMKTIGIKGHVANISIPIWPDANPDATETFTISLHNVTGTGVTLIRPTSTVTILHN
jgi:alpha-tubulin suppressor-like RCC1 family protein